MSLIRPSCTHLDRTSFHCLFNSLVRPHLEYCVSTWCPLFRKDEDLIENILLRQIFCIGNWNSLPYEVVNVGSLDSFKSNLDNA